MLKIIRRPSGDGKEMRSGKSAVQQKMLNSKVNVCTAIQICSRLPL
jgi:hypothetical protein